MVVDDLDVFRAGLGPPNPSLPTVEVEFIVNEEEAERLLELIEKEGVSLFYARIPAQFAIVNPGQQN